VKFSVGHQNTKFNRNSISIFENEVSGRGATATRFYLVQYVQRLHSTGQQQERMSKEFALSGEIIRAEGNERAACLFNRLRSARTAQLSTW
jgi:hypothetical protein